MKHATSRFLRFFLVAALVAAMVGSLLPAKVVGQEADDVTAVASTMATGEAIMWTITFEGVLLNGLDADGDADPNETATDVELTFAGLATLEDVPTDDAGDPISTTGLITVNGTDVESFTVAGQVITFTPPDDVGTPEDTTTTPTTDAVPGEIKVVIASNYGDEDKTPITAHAEAVATDVTVSASIDGTAVGEPSDTISTYIRPALKDLTSLRTGQVARWDATSQNVATEVTKDEHEITVTFSAGTVPSVIDKSSIRVISNAPGDEGTGAGSPALNPSVNTGTRTIRFVSPVDVEGAAESTLRVIISESANIAAPSQPSKMTITIKAGEANTAATSAEVDVGRYVNFSPRSAKRGTTVSVTGGGFTPNTSGDIKIGDPPEAAGGTFSVDSAGKLTGSFVVNGKNGKISAQDLGASGADPTFSSATFTTAPSATPDKTEVTQGSSVSVKVRDFADTTFTVMLAGTTVTLADDAYAAATRTLTIPIGQTEGLGTKQVSIADSTGKIARFSLTIVPRTLTVSPSSAVPGQAITVSGAGFIAGRVVDLELMGASNATVKIAGTGTDPAVPAITVTNDGTFLWTGKVPFANGITDSMGSKTWKATETATGGRAATSSGFKIQPRAITLSPSTANPGATVEVYGTGWGVTTRGTVNSQVTLTMKDGEGRAIANAQAGPFPVSSSGEFTGAITVPADVGVQRLTVIATDNNGPADDGGTGGFTGNQMAERTLMVPTGVVSVSPSMASTGSVITVTGSGFPAQTNLSALSFGTANALPVPAPSTDVSGRFTVTLTVPAAAGGGSLQPGAVVITARVASISGTTSFTIPGPAITLSTAEARPGDTISISGTNFSAFSNVATINVGQQNQAPTPNPLTDPTGNFTANVLMPALNPGAYTITVRTGPAFTATASIRILSATVGSTVPAEMAFQALTSRGILTLAAAAPPGGTMFGAYVPDLAGNTLVNVEPNGVLILTLNADARVSVSGQPAVDVTANTPTFFALGSTVSVEVIE